MQIKVVAAVKENTFSPLMIPALCSFPISKLVNFCFSSDLQFLQTAAVRSFASGGQCYLSQFPPLTVFVFENSFKDIKAPKFGPCLEFSKVKCHRRVMD